MEGVDGEADYTNVSYGHSTFQASESSFDTEESGLTEAYSERRNNIKFNAPYLLPSSLSE